MEELKADPQVRAIVITGAGDKAFLSTRIAVAQFFAEQLLPQAEALLGPVTRGAAGPFALGADEIGH